MKSGNNENNHKIGNELDSHGVDMEKNYDPLPHQDIEVGFEDGIMGDGFAENLNFNNDL